MPRSRNSPGMARAQQRREEALRLRIAGLRYRDIGERLGITMQAAHHLVVKALEESRARAAESADQLRDLELQRLDVAQSVIWRYVLEGDMGAIDRLLKIQQRRAALMGLDAPERREIGGIAQGAPIRIETYDYAAAAVALSGIDDDERRVEE